MAWLKAVIGLGNPGELYRGTRHNVGFEALERLAERSAGRWKRGWRIRGQSCTIRLFESPLLLIKPRTYMNRSGECAVRVCRRQGIAPAEMLVVMDDVDLPPGRIRVRTRGRAGGHNGLKSIQQELGTDDYPRLRIGVGGAAPDETMTEHVLGRFTPAEREQVDDAIDRAADAIEMMVARDIEAAMNTFNTKS